MSDTNQAVDMKNASSWESYQQNKGQKGFGILKTYTDEKEGEQRIPLYKTIKGKFKKQGNCKNIVKPPDENPREF